MEHYFQGRKILIGVTGSIAAYKALDLVSQLKKLGAEVRVVMTKGACEFVTPLSFEALSHHKVLTDVFKDPLAHISWAKWADLILIAPASANFLANYTQGFASDMLLTLLLASTARVAIAPAMNQAMWAHPAVQANVATLKSRAVDFIGPSEGQQACGDIGFGRMMEVIDIISHLPKYFMPQHLRGKKVLITAGPTQEPLDPVRYLTNYSSGKMGYALAQSCYAHGAEVSLISGPTQLGSPKYCNNTWVTRAKQMHQEVLHRAQSMDIIIGCAAVCDFKPEHYQAEKIKKPIASYTLALSQNEDILAALGRLSPKPFLVGFAAETQDLLKNAQKKLKDKNLDVIIANQVGNDLGFNQDEQEVTIINRKGILQLEKSSKAKLADQIVKHLATLQND